MTNHIQNLHEYIEKDAVYNYYLKRPKAKLNDFEKFCIEHIEDIKWALDELDALYLLVEEMKNKYESKGK